MLLAIDIGNTMTDFGLLDDAGNLKTYRIRSRRDLTLEEAVASFSLFLKSKSIDPASILGAIISSVVPTLTGVYRDLCVELFHVEALTLGPRLKTGVKIVTDNPKEVGADMIAGAAGIRALKKTPCLVIDFGTATKVYLVDKEGAFAGCSIGAGLGLQASSLSSSAALLPEFSPQIPTHFLGKNTVDCMNVALTYGNAFAVKGIADAIEKEVGYPCQRVLTGGFASAVKPLFDEYEYEPNLILLGLSYIYGRNAR